MSPDRVKCQFLSLPFLKEARWVLPGGIRPFSFMGVGHETPPPPLHTVPTATALPPAPPPPPRP